MLGLVVEVRPLQAHFRIPYNSLLLDSYPFPPRTTAIGMLAGAMGLSEEGFRRLLRELKYGVIVQDPGARVEETAAIFKSVNSPLYPITKVLFHRPHYRMFFAGDEKLIERAYDSLLDPVFTPYVGDSESLLYPAKGDWARLVEVEEGSESTLRSIIPAEEYAKGARFLVIRRNNLTPREYRVPMDFTYSGKDRRAVYQRVIAFAGGFVELANPVSVLLFDGEPVFVF
ncbi:MAG: CRISPR-associated protein Cas5h [Thermococcaceae archaeon]|uniref:CRISPR-associated protein Cas5 n=1 Tax=Thermococcus TaxID=2263 RepID=UPI0005B2A470|nr:MULTISPECIES: CRISPR-associated protein Cas5 [Thermococcus]KUK03951.1 MAG: CRISPR-associated protein Cas5 [Euryarchaeota archaeon 55_53]KUK29458.1 MAG: CRISPR-associated protein Cas5 [Methanosarcinales archeaon 56_1174]MDI3476306.1 CRISPR-associated protein Cas5h [Thermococcaceae archaeon]MCA6213800.1 CRISPR-associated protein Cas5 [Thermococcus bergensis]MDK2915305.1 CRISPR-associated protein Cas5h [Thermococcaceae archaeon]